MKKLHAVYFLQVIESFTGSLIGIFIPIYLFLSGYPLKQVIFYLIIYSLAILIFFFLTGWLASRIGLRNILIIRMPFLFLYLLILYFLDKIQIPLSIIALINAWQTALYWFPLHVLFTNYSSEEKMGTELGNLLALPKLISVIAPILGGAISVLFGFKSLFFFAILFYGLSFVPLLYIPALKSLINLNYTKLSQLFSKYKNYFLAETLINIGKEAEGIIWPIFVFIAFKSLLSIGAIGTFVGIGGAIFTYLVGKSVDKYDRKKILIFGAIVMIFIWLSRFFLTGQITYYILSLLAGFFSALVILPFSTYIYKFAKKDNIDEFIIFREFPVFLGRIIIYSFALLFISNLKWSFLIVAASYIYLFAF